MELNVLLRGQSNSIILGTLLGQNGNTALINEVNRLLGFDGVTDKVSLRFEWLQPYGGANTAVGGTALIGDWLTPVTSNGQLTWQNNSLETGLLSYISALPAAVKAEPTVVLWLHNEYDSANPNLNTSVWESAVRTDAAQVRAAFGSNVPYVFVEPIPYPSGTDTGAQAIRVGMADLTSDPGFNAIMTGETDDLAMDATVFGAGGHMNSADATAVALRAARSIATEFAAYAKPGSPMSAGNIDDIGPLVTHATPIGTHQLLVTVAFDAATTLAPLGAVAASGAGWSVHAGSAVINATSVAIASANTLVVTFGSDLPAGGSLFYSWGNAQLGTNGAVYDDTGMPVHTAVNGLLIGGALQDFNGSGTSDILWHGQGGEVAIWQMNGTQVTGGGFVASPGAYWTIAGSGDFNGDGHADLVWRGAGGEVGIWQMNGTQVTGGSVVGLNPGGYWSIAGTGDFDGDGHADILFRGQGGEAAVWQMNGAQLAASTVVGLNPGSYWKVAGTGDFNADGKADVAFQGQAGEIAIWAMNGPQVLANVVVGTNPGTSWTVAGTGDFNGDGHADLLFHGADGSVSIWEMNGAQVVAGGMVGNPGNYWSIADVGDYNGDGHADILFRGQGGEVSIWAMNGLQVAAGGSVGNPGTYYSVIG